MSRAQLVADVLDTMACLRRCLGPSKSAGAAKNAPTRAQLGILMLVSCGEAIGIKELAAHLGMSSSAATQLVNALVETRLLARRDDAGDRRKIVLSLTDKGSSMLHKARKERIKSLQMILTPLTDDELRQLATLQRKISVAHA